MSENDTNPDEGVSQTDGGKPQPAGSEPREFNQQTSPVTYGESVTDIFSRPDTKPMLMQTVAIFAALGIGFGLFGYFAVDTMVSGGENPEDAFAAFGGVIAALVIVFTASLAGPVVSITTSIRTNGILAYLKDDLSYATGVVGAAAGQAVLMTITVFLVTSPIPDEMEMSFGEFTNLILLSVVVTAIAAAVVMYALRNISDPVRPSN